MKVLSARIVVDKLPNACWQCPMMRNIGTEEHRHYICVPLDGGRNNLGSDPFNLPFRRHDCPLVVEEKGVEKDERTDETEA